MLAASVALLISGCYEVGEHKGSRQPRAQKAAETGKGSPAEKVEAASASKAVPQTASKAQTGKPSPQAKTEKTLSATKTSKPRPPRSEDEAKPENEASAENPGAAGEAAGKPAPTGLLVDAEQLFAQSKFRESVNMVMAEGVARANPQVMESLRWSPGLKRPAVVVRFGIVGQVIGAENALKSRQVKLYRDARFFWNRQFVQPVVRQLDELAVADRFGKWIHPPTMPDSVVADPSTSESPPAGEGEAQALTDGNVKKTSLSGVQTRVITDDRNLIRDALLDGLDVLVVCTIKATPQRLPGVNKMPTNVETSIRVKILDVWKNEVAWNSSTITTKSIKVVDRDVTNSIKALVSDTVDHLTGYYALEKMPSLTPEVVRSRAEYLGRQQYANPLPALLELRYYETQKLLTPEEAGKSFVGILGEVNGRRWNAGNVSDRLQILRRYME
jgi:hypothetical protein